MVVHIPHSNYRLFCPECAHGYGDWISAVPVKILFTEMENHNSQYHHRNKLETTHDDDPNNPKNNPDLWNQ